MTSIRPSTCMTSVASKSVAVGSRHMRHMHLIFALCLAAVANTACSKDQPTKDQLLSRADASFAADQYDKAEKEYRDVLRLEPEDPTARRQLGIIYFDQGQLRQAFPLLRQSAELRPDDLDLQLKLGLAYLAGGAHEEARDTATQVLDKQPGNEQALMLLVDAADTPDSIEETRKFVENLPDRERNRPGYHLALGALDLRQKKDEARAESEFKEALKLDPKSSAAHMALGSLYWRRQDLNAADQAFKAAADLAPLRSSIRMAYVDFKLQTGAAAEAKNILEEMTRRLPDYLPSRVYLMKMVCAEHPDDDCVQRVQNILAQYPLNFDALFQSASLSLAKGDAEKAASEFEQLGSMYGQNPQVRYELARAYVLNAMKASEVKSRTLAQAAEEQLTVATRLDPKFVPAALLLAELKMRKGNAAAAVDLLTPITKERPQIAQAQYLLASAYLALQKKDQALTVYRQMTELFPQDPQPSFLTGMILLEQRQQMEARNAFLKAVEISPKYLPAAEVLVNLDIADKQYAAAMDRAQKLIDVDPKQASPWVFKAKIYLAQQDFTRAEADLLKAIELDPKLAPAYTLLAQLYVASNRQEQAIEKLNALTETNKNVLALMQLAGIHEQLKNFAAAGDAYEKLLAVAPNFGPALNNLAVLYAEHLGQPDKGYELAKRAREVGPKEPHVADTLGWILFKKGDYGNALQLLQEGAGNMSDRPEVQFHLGMAHYMMGEEEPARLALQKAADADKDFPDKDEARRRLALLALPVGTANAAARTELENYLRERPNDPVALSRLAQLQQRQGAVDEAVKTYEKVLADYPLFAPATRQLAMLYGQRLTDEPKAYELVTKARQAYPNDPEIAKTLGILNYRRGFYPQSSELLKEAAAKRKDDPELVYYLGAVQRQLKQYTECKETLQRALALNLSPQLADDARTALADCAEMAQ